METTNDDISARELPVPSTPAPRLPTLPTSRWEGVAQLALGLASVAMYWLLLAAIIQFVPRADVFVERVRQAPEMLVSPAYVLRSLEASPAAQTNRPLAAEPGTHRQMDNNAAACSGPVG